MLLKLRKWVIQLSVTGCVLCMRSNKQFNYKLIFVFCLIRSVYWPKKTSFLFSNLYSFILDCDTYYEPIGCYKDYNNKPRPLPKYILTERDYSHHTYEGNLIKWQEWNNYSPLMLCRCATKAKKMGYTTFSMQFFGKTLSSKFSL